jgi:hypothetical protein
LVFNRDNNKRNKKAFKRNPMKKNLLLMSLLFVSVGALADDIILSPGEARSIYVDQPGTIRVACVADSTPPPPSNIVFATAEGKTPSLCANDAQIISAMNYIPSVPGRTALIGAQCDEQNKVLKITLNGIRVGERGEFKVALSDESSCWGINLLAADVNQTISTAGAITTRTHCEDRTHDKWISILVSRFN